MILTGAAFVKKSYIEDYLKLPSSIHEFVEENNNCEDIAFNMMVSRTTKNPPIYVSPIRFRNLDSESKGSPGIYLFIYLFIIIIIIFFKKN